MNGRQITLALGGGGARGVAHLGVIEVLLEAGFEIERIVGVSIGSLAGALYATETDIQRVQRRTIDYLTSDQFQKHQQILFGASPQAGEATTGGVFTWYDRIKDYLKAKHRFYRVVNSLALLPGVVLHDVVDYLLPDADISDTQIPLSIVAVDLITGHKVVFEKGSIRDTVRASSALPGIFPPVEIDEMLLCDVGVLYSLPTTVARSYTSGCLAAVDVSSDLKRMPHCDTALDVLMRMDEVGEALFRKQVREAADVVICPEVSDVEWFDFSASEKLVEAGRVAARRMLPTIEKMMTGS